MIIKKGVSPARPLILELGDYYLGDQGLGGHCGEALNAHWASLGCDVEYLDLAEVPAHAATRLVEREAVFGIASLRLGRDPGRLCLLDRNTARYRLLAALEQYQEQHQGHSTAREQGQVRLVPSILAALEGAAALAELATGTPVRLRVACFEPVRVEGFGLSLPAKAAVRRIMALAGQFLELEPAAPATPIVPWTHRTRLTRLHRLPLLGEVV
ncbi:hypothetical protein [Megalodesulfovibrio paquesii]